MVAEDINAFHALRPRRILVAGSGGAGKSTLCREIGERLGVPYTDLDLLFFCKDQTVRPTFISELAVLVSGSEWITEWNIEEGRELLGSRAQFLIWIDLRRWRTTWRSLARSMRSRRANSTEWTEPPLYTILLNPYHGVRWSYVHHEQDRAMTSDFIRNNPGIPSITLRSPREVKAFRTSLSAQFGSAPLGGSLDHTVGPEGLEPPTSTV
jgi:hypothetical protein